MRQAMKARVLNLRTEAHRAIFVATGGRLLRSWGGLPVVALTTTGRKTGTPRTTVLVTPVADGRSIILVASNGGASAHPDWLLNLAANPDVDVLTGTGRGPMRARVATPEEEARLWPGIIDRSPSYGRYQQRTTRHIPLVVLEPTPSAALS